MVRTSETCCCASCAIFLFFLLHFDVISDLFNRELLYHGRRVGDEKKNRSTSGQRGNKFSTSYRDISVIVAENNSVVKPKYQQYTSLNKMFNNFSKVLMAHISFTAVINNRGIGKGIGGILKGTKKNYIYVL